MFTQSFEITPDIDWAAFADKLRQELRLSQAEIVFTKKDGTVRTMRCTLNTAVIPPAPQTESKKQRAVNNSVMAVYDVDVNGWRSFTVNQVKSVKLIA